MTFIEKFDSIKKKYGKIDESKLNENFAVQVEMTDEDCGGIFYVAYMNSPFAIEPYNYYDNTASVALKSKTLEAVLSGKADAVNEYTSGNIKVEGNIDHVLMLVDIMKKEPRKRAVKKTDDSASKKTVKKSAKKTSKK